MDISDQSVKYVELERFKDGIHLRSFGKESFEKGLVEAGQIKEREKFVKFLKDFRNKLKNNYLIIALPEEKVFIGTIRLPLMKEEEIRTSLEFQLEEHVPLPIREAIFDYEVEGEISDDKSLKTRRDYLNASFTAAPSVLVRSYHDVFKEAGFVPLVFETEPHALIRALIRPEEKRVQLIIDFGKTRTSFVIVHGTRIGLTSTIKVAGEALDSALVQAFSVTPEEGSRLKREKGLLGGKENEKLFSALLPVVSSISREAKRHLTYWETHTDDIAANKGIERAILCGGDANLIGLAEYLCHELKIPVELANPWINITPFEDYIPEIEFNDSLMYATAIGLALRSILAV